MRIVQRSLSVQQKALHTIANGVFETLTVNTNCFYSASLRQKRVTCCGSPYLNGTVEEPCKASTIEKEQDGYLMVDNLTSVIFYKARARLNITSLPVFHVEALRAFQIH